MGGVCVSVCMCVSFHMGGLTCGGCILWMDDKLRETNTEFNYCSEVFVCLIRLTMMAGSFQLKTKENQ